MWFSKKKVGINLTQTRHVVWAIDEVIESLHKERSSLDLIKDEDQILGLDVDIIVYKNLRDYLNGEYKKYIGNNIMDGTGKC
jgi:hypothetical protein